MTGLLPVHPPGYLERLSHAGGGQTAAPPLFAIVGDTSTPPLAGVDAAAAAAGTGAGGAVGAVGAGAAGSAVGV